MNVALSKRAVRDIVKIQKWWSEHRPAARDLFLDELAGTVYIARKRGLVRRIVLIAVWGATRARGPSL